MKFSNRYTRLWMISAIILTIISNYTSAQNNQDTSSLDTNDLIGFWAFKDNTGDTFYLIIKKAGRASSFWTGQASNEIEKGEWVTDGNRIIITWLTGFRDVFARTGEDFFKDAYLPGAPLDIKPESTLRAKRVSRNIVGNLVVETSPDDSEITDNNQLSFDASLPSRSQYIGFWEISENQNDTFYLFLKRGGGVEYASPSRREVEKKKGVWLENRDEAIITWEDNTEGKIILSAESYTYEGIEKGGVFGINPINFTQAKRITAEKAQDYFTFGKPHLASGESFMGHWEVGDENAYRYFIHIESWGKCTRIKYNLDEGLLNVNGRWTLIKDGLQITFNDGYKDTIRLTEKGIEKATFAPESAITGIPLSVSSAKKVHESTIQEWLELMRKQDELARKDQNTE